MDLDPRIYKDRKPLDCFDIQKAKKFLGAKGYFSSCIEDFSDLNLTHYGTLLDIDDRSAIPYGLDDDEYYVFFLPSAWVRNTEEEQQFAEDCLQLTTLIYSFLNCHTQPHEIMERHDHEREQFLKAVFNRALLGNPWDEVR